MQATKEMLRRLTGDEEVENGRKVSRLHVLCDVSFSQNFDTACFGALMIDVRVVFR